MTATATTGEPASARPDAAPPAGARARLAAVLGSGRGRVAALTLAGLVVAIALLVGGVPAPWREAPLWAVVGVGGAPLLVDIARALLRREAGADLLAALAILGAIALGEWYVAAIIVLMLSGGEALEEAATRRASAVLAALARRSPQVAHRREDGALVDVDVAQVLPGDVLVVLPHELCPVDGEVVEGRGAMDESYLTGEPYVIAKSPGSAVMSGAVNQEAVLVVRAERSAADSRYAQIVGVLRQAEEHRPRMRRLADRLGAWYTVLAVSLAAIAWLVSGDPGRALAVVVVATPCPLLIGVPVAIIGAISLAAKVGIIVRDPTVLEQVGRVDTVLFDKTGTLTYGRATLTDVVAIPGVDPDEVLALAAAVERYSRHPLAVPVVEAAEALGLPDPPVAAITERPGQGLRGDVAGRQVRVTSRRQLLSEQPGTDELMPSTGAGLECAVLLDGRYAATLRFRDEPRLDASRFVAHLLPAHGIARTVIVSGDRAAEVHHLAQRVGIAEVHAGCSPEDKLRIVRAETARGRTLFLGDGVNDAPAMTAATVGVAFGNGADVTSEAAGAVVLDSSLERVDDLLHIGTRLRRIALQSALGGIALSAIGMSLAVVGLLPPLLGALAQEGIDLLAVLNAARVPFARGRLNDLDRYPL